MKDESEKKECSKKPWDLREQTIQFSLMILKLCSLIPDTAAGRLVRNQVIRSGTSPGAQYREAQRARSSAEFVSKMENALQELDETEYWLELLQRAELLHHTVVNPVKQENSRTYCNFYFGSCDRKKPS